MANRYVQANKVVMTDLGVLEREVVLPNLVWRDPGESFTGVKNKVVTISVPAYVTPRTRTLYSNTPITVDEFAETSVDVKLDTHIYKAIGIRDEELTLDVVDFVSQVQSPATDAIARGIEDNVVSAMNAAPYAVTQALSPGDDMWDDIVDARTALGKARVPAGGRFLAVGANVEGALLKSKRFTSADSIGDARAATALGEASLGRIAGLTVVSVPGLDPDWAIMAHKTAFVQSLVAPEVPAGASWGAVGSYNGFSLRVLRDYEPTASNGPRDRLLTDVFAGSGFVTDKGVIDGAGQFQPGTTGDEPSLFVRAVKLVLEGQS